nr:uncharacterized protein LOC123282444 isoform X4 [Equus asinus]
MRVASWLELAPRIVWRSVHIGVPWPRALTLRTVPPLSVTGSCEDDVSCSQVLTTCLISQVQTKEEPLPPASSQSIPTFYFPRGRPQGTVNVDAVIAKIERTFAQFPHERATMEDMGKVAKRCLLESRCYVIALQTIWWPKQKIYWCEGWPPFHFCRICLR